MRAIYASMNLDFFMPDIQSAARAAKLEFSSFERSQQTGGSSVLPQRNSACAPPEKVIEVGGRLCLMPQDRTRAVVPAGRLLAPSRRPEGLLSGSPMALVIWRQSWPIPDS